MRVRGSSVSFGWKDLGFSMWFWILRFGVWGFIFEVNDSRFGVRGLGFGIQGLGFGVWGLGIKV